MNGSNRSIKKHKNDKMTFVYGELGSIQLVYTLLMISHGGNE